MLDEYGLDFQNKSNLPKMSHKGISRDSESGLPLPSLAIIAVSGYPRENKKDFRECGCRVLGNREDSDTRHPILEDL